MSERREPVEIEPWVKAPAEDADRVSIKSLEGDDFDDPWLVVAEKPRKRDFWKVLRGKWEPRIHVGRRASMKRMDAWMKWHWRPEAEVNKQLYAKSPLLEALANGPKDADAVVSVHVSKSKSE